MDSLLHGIMHFIAATHKDEKIMLFEPTRPAFLSVPSIFFTGSLLTTLKRTGVLVMMRMQTWKGTELLQVLKVTTNRGVFTTRCYTNRRLPLPLPLPAIATQTVKCLVKFTAALLKFATALLMCSCGRYSQMVCRAIFNSSVGWNLRYFSNMALQT